MIIRAFDIFIVETDITSGLSTSSPTITIGLQKTVIFIVSFALFHFIC